MLTEQCLDSGMNSHYDSDHISQGYAQITGDLNCLTKDDILQIYSSEQDFRWSPNAEGG